MRKTLTATVIAAAILFCFASAAHAKKEIKYALAILHYNLQYVAGDEVIENRIIKNSLEPMVDLFLQHENWGAEFEMQGYMLEQTAIRYPEIFAKLKKLLERNQAELMCFHYSDQLFLAYPRRDLEWSEELNQETFKNLGVKRSGSVFTQEGQFGEGMADFMKANDFRVLSWPKNLFRFLHGEVQVAPYYDIRGIKTVVAGRGVQYEDENTIVKTEWTYLNDAELLPTGGATPYSEEYFKPNQKAISEYENRLAELEKQGFKIGNLTQYVTDLEAAGVPAPKPPEPLDGVWQPVDTMNIFRWMGDYHGAHERDNEVLTGNVAARHKVLAAETALAFAKKSGVSLPAGLDAKLRDAKRAMSLAQCSDSTGWTPIQIEIKYSVNNAKKAAAASLEIIDAVKKALGAQFIRIDTKSGKVEAIAQKPTEPALPAPSKCPVEIKLSGEMKSQSIDCYESAPGIWKVLVKTDTIKWHSNNFALKFARTTDKITYSPALIDGETVTYSLSDFNLEKDWIYLPSPNGLIALGDDLFLIKKTDTVHVTFRFPSDEKVVALEMLKPANANRTWEFAIVRGTAAKALEVADSMNVHPIVVE